MKQKNFYDQKEASEKFDEAWQDIEKQAKELLKSDKFMKDEIFALINGYYINEIMQNRFEGME